MLSRSILVSIGRLSAVRASTGEGVYQLSERPCQLFVKADSRSHSAVTLRSSSGTTVEVRRHSSRRAHVDNLSQLIQARLPEDCPRNVIAFVLCISSSVPTPCCFTPGGARKIVESDLLKLYHCSELVQRRLAVEPTRVGKYRWPAFGHPYQKGQPPP